MDLHDRNQPAPLESGKASPLKESIPKSEKDAQRDARRIRQAEDSRDHCLKAFEEQKILVLDMENELKAMRDREELRDRENAQLRAENLRIQAEANRAKRTTHDWKLAARVLAEASVKAGAGSRKRSATEDCIQDLPAKKAKPNRGIPCTKCFVNNRQCSSSTENCTECISRGEPYKCKRVCCKNFRTGTCENKKCCFAHEDDGCTRLIPYKKLKKVAQINARRNVKGVKMIEGNANKRIEKKKPGQGLAQEDEQKNSQDLQGPNKLGNYRDNTNDSLCDDDTEAESELRKLQSEAQEIIEEMFGSEAESDDPDKV